MAFEGAVAALEGCGPDHPRHVAASLRAVLFHAIGRYVSPRPGDSQQQKLRHLTGSTKEARLINETLQRLTHLLKGPPATHGEAISAFYYACGAMNALLTAAEVD